MADGNVAPSGDGHKTCRGCGKTKSLSQFNIKRDNRDGLAKDCKTCTSAWFRMHFQRMKARRPEVVSEKECTGCKQILPAVNFGKRTDAKDGLKHECKACSKVRHSRWLEENRERHRAVSRAHYHANRERHAKKHREWIAANPEKYAANKRRSWMKKRSSPKGRLEHAVSAKIRNSVRRGSKFGRRTFEVLGYSAEDLHRHLERYFEPGMTWANYGEWHIDHRIPLAAFNYETPDDFDFKRAWALSNLCPMWAVKNRQKSDKLDKPFQPSLAF